MQKLSENKKFLEKVILSSKYIHSTGVKKAATYAGILYYEEDGVEDLLTFTAAKKLNALIEVSI